LAYPPIYAINTVMTKLDKEIIEQASAVKTELSPELQTPVLLADRYRYVSCIGEGSVGKTYKAFDRQSGNAVAIKSLKIRSVDSWKSYELFERESKILKALDIEGVPKFYAFIEDIQSDDPQSYIVQEYIDAPSLQKLLDEGMRFSEEECVAIAIEVLSILEKLHNMNPPLIHRDIKPSNILLERRNDGEKAFNCYLIDFGSVANPQFKGESSTVAGTFGYMPPEQILGDCQSASDLHAFGATLLHLLSGVAPYTMSSEVFKLQYESHLAPNTSPSVRALLAELLEPELLHRLNDTNIALDWLKAIQEKREFHYKKKARTLKSEKQKPLKVAATELQQLDKIWLAISLKEKQQLCEFKDKVPMELSEALIGLGILAAIAILVYIAFATPYFIHMMIFTILAVPTAIVLTQMPKNTRFSAMSDPSVLEHDTQIIAAKVISYDDKNVSTMVRYFYVVEGISFYGEKQLRKAARFKDDTLIVAYNIERVDKHCIVFGKSPYA
jgi:serine/threonine protein kinase